MLKSIWKKWPFLFKFRLVMGIILFIIILIFLYLKVVPFGHITYERDYTKSFRSGKGFILGFTPAERVDLKSSEAPRLIGDPVYFSVFTPRTFDKAKMTIVYRDNLALETPIVEAGVLVDNVVWRYDLQPVDNKALDYLMLKWNKIEENGLVFLQKEKNYNSLAEWNKDFTSNNLKGCSGGAEKCLAVYNYSPDYNYQISNYRTGQPIVLDKPLRGAHQFYVYLNNEPLRLEFILADLNQDLKPAPININIYSGNTVIASGSLPDANLKPGSGEVEEKSLILQPKNLKPGVYKVEVKITDDMVIKKISSSVNHLSFINKIWPVSTTGALTLYTDSAYLQVKALNPASLQTINFGGEDFKVTEPYLQFDFKTSSLVKNKAVVLKKDNLVLENNGVFAWSTESLFNPSLAKVDRYFSVSTDANYIVANYKKPFTEEGIKTATVEFNLKDAYRENGKYSFMISIPGLKAEDNIDDSLEIYQIKIELNGRTLWQKIWQ